MSFAPLGNSWNSTTPRRSGRTIPDSLWKSLPTPRNIAELGPDGGHFAAQLLKHWPESSYRGFDVSETMVTRTLAELTAYRGRAFAAQIDPSCEMPLPDKSQDFLLSCQVLEVLRMDQLYMSCAEARRVLREGGHWLLACTAKKSGIAGSLQSWFSRERAMELTHYISPEDWETVSNQTIEGLQYLLLRRLAG